MSIPTGDHVFEPAFMQKFIEGAYGVFECSIQRWTVPSDSISENMTRARIMTWGTLLRNSSDYKMLLRPHHMTFNDNSFVELTALLEQFVNKPSMVLWLLVKNKFLTFVKLNFESRKFFIWFSSAYTEQETRLHGINAFENFRKHMTMLFDNDISMDNREIWNVQCAYCRQIFFSDISMAQKFNPELMMLDQTNLDNELENFKTCNGTEDNSLTLFLQTFTQFTQRIILSEDVVEIFSLLEVPTILHNRLPALIEYGVKKMLLIMADIHSTDRTKILNAMVTMNLERYYEGHLVKLFNEEVQRMSQDIDFVFEETIRRTQVFNMWMDKPPVFMQRLLDLHLRLWSPFYLQMLLRL